MNRHLSNRRSLLLLAVISIASIPSCTRSTETLSASMTASVSLSVAETRGADITGAWRLLSLSDIALSEHQTPFEVDISTDRITVQRGCNQWKWSYTLIDAVLTTVRLSPDTVLCSSNALAEDATVVQFLEAAPVAALDQSGALVIVMDERQAVLRRHSR